MIDALAHDFNKIFLGFESVNVASGLPGASLEKDIQLIFLEIMEAGWHKNHDDSLKNCYL